MSDVDSVDMDSDEHTFESSSDRDEDGSFEGYINEPGYSEKEMEILGLLSETDEENNSSSSSSSDADQDSRLENLHWCTCTRCVITSIKAKFYFSILYSLPDILAVLFVKKFYHFFFEK